jgi:hypothetical protein
MSLLKYFHYFPVIHLKFSTGRSMKIQDPVSQLREKIEALDVSRELGAFPQSALMFGRHELDLGDTAGATWQGEGWGDICCGKMGKGDGNL